MSKSTLKVKEKQGRPQAVVCQLGPEVASVLANIEAVSDSNGWSLKQFKQEFGNRYSRTYGGRLEGMLAGYLTLHVVLDEVHIVKLAVTPGMRRRGVAQKLLQQVLIDLFASGSRQAYLEVRVSNQAAINLYTSLGFQQVGCRKAYYSDNGEDALLMRVDLQQLVELGTQSKPFLRDAG